MTDTTVPPVIERRLGRCLTALREVADALEQGRVADRMFSGQGRYEADAIANTAAISAAATFGVERFRERAAFMGVDAEAFIKGLGGMPDLTPSAQAKEWMAPASSHPEGALYRYRMTLRPPGLGCLPSDGLVPGSHIDDGQRFGTVDYRRQLTAAEIDNFDMVREATILPEGAKA